MQRVGLLSSDTTSDTNSRPARQDNNSPAKPNPSNSNFNMASVLQFLEFVDGEGGGGKVKAVGVLLQQTVANPFDIGPTNRRHRRSCGRHRRRLYNRRPGFKSRPGILRKCAPPAKGKVFISTI